MAEESHSFAKTRVRLEEIVTQVRKKDTSLEKSLDLLEEGVRLANQCTELIDHADWEAAMAEAQGDAADAPDATDESTSGSTDGLVEASTGDSSAQNTTSDADEDTDEGAESDAGEVADEG